MMTASEAPTFRALHVPEIRTALYYEPKITSWRLAAWMVLPDGDFVSEFLEIEDFVQYSEDLTFELIRKVFERFMATRLEGVVNVREG